ncbi:MAG: exosortase U [Aureliella sp.]
MTTVSSTVKEKPAVVRRVEALQPLVPLVIALACLPYTFIYFVNLWQFAHYQFFPVLLAAVVWLLWQRLGNASDFGWPLRWLSLGLLLAGAGGAVCATIFASPWMGYFGFASAVSSWLAGRKDRGASGSLLYLALPIGLLWQPPYNTIITADTVLIQTLQTVSAKLSSRWLDGLGYVHFQPGTVLEFAGKRFGVAEACSGIQSFFAVVCFAALICAYMRRGPLHSLLLMATSPVWAILMNTFRITLIPVAYAGIGVDLSHGLVHDLLGFATMGLAIVLLVSADELLLKLREFSPQVPKWMDLSRLTSQSGTTAVSRLNWVLVGVVALPAIGCALLQTNDAIASWGNQKKTIDFFRDDPLLPMSYRDAPNKLGGWSQIDYVRENRERDNDDLGQQSDLWYYASPHGRVSLSFDQMFPGWHELTRCYRSAGWQLDKRSVLPRELTGEWPAVTAEFSRNGEYGFLVWSLKTRNGKPVQPPGEWNTWTSLKERLQNRLTPSVRGALFGIAAYQMQVFVSGVEPVPDIAKNECVEAFLDARGEIWTAAIKRIDDVFGR